MPQMAPMNWLFLFFYMISIFMMFNTLNYFSYMSTKTFSSNKMKNMLTNWKW